MVVLGVSCVSEASGGWNEGRPSGCAGPLLRGMALPDRTSVEQRVSSSESCRPLPSRFAASPSAARFGLRANLLVAGGVLSRFPPPPNRLGISICNISCLRHPCAMLTLARSSMPYLTVDESTTKSVMSDIEASQRVLGRDPREAAWEANVPVRIDGLKQEGGCAFPLSPVEKERGSQLQKPRFLAPP